MVEIEKKIQLLLYHGTNKECSDKILQEGFKTPVSIRRDHWLGQGIYFFREDIEQAKIWAISKFRGQEVQVIELKTEVDINKFLNLDTRSGLIIFQKFLDKIEKVSGDVNIEFDSDPAILRNMIMDMLPQQYTVIQRTFDVKSIRFDDDKQLAAMGLHLHGTQVCFREEKVTNKNMKVVLRKQPQSKAVTTR